MDELLQKKTSELKIGELEKLIDYLNKEYRNGTEVVTDQKFDKYIARLRELKPKSRFLREIGAPVRDELVKAKLPLWMGSMDNSIFPDTKPLTRWLKKYGGPYFCSAKLDGLSALYCHPKGSPEPSLFTRGDGKVGQDISYLLDYLCLPSIDEGDYVRGELIMKDSIFKSHYAKEFPKARSVVSGTINSKKPNAEILGRIDFLGFEYLEEGKKQGSADGQFETLCELGFHVPINRYIEGELTTEVLIPLFQEFKDISQYEIDGVIVADNNQHSRNIKGNPDFAIAFKMNAEGEKTTIEEVIWDPSMYGVLVPTIHFHTVQIGGDNVSYASAFNAKYVKDNRLRKGKEIEIVKSGDVIPFISKVHDSPHLVSGRKADMPHEEEFGDFEWNETGVDLVLINPLDNPIVRRKRLIRFFTALEIKHINVGVVKKFIKAGYTSPKEIYELTVEEMADELEGVKEKNAQKYYDSIHGVLDNPIPVEKVMKASLSFGNGFGERRLYPLVSGIKMIEKVDAGKRAYHFKKPTKEEIMEFEGYQEKTADKFLAGFSHFRKFMRMNEFIKLKLPSSSDGERGSGGPLADKYILFTGVRDKPLMEKLKDAGAHIENNFTKKTNLLVVKSTTDNNKKIERAKEEGIEMITLDEAEGKLFG